MTPLHPLKIMLSALFLCVLLSFVVIADEPTAQRAPAFKWQSAAPEEAGLSTEALSALHRDLLAGKYGYIDSFLIVRHQKIVFEQYFSHDYSAIYGEEAITPGSLVINDPTGPYNYFNAFWHPFYKGTTLHTLQSVTKSVVSLTLGMAIAQGDLPSLDTPVLSFFDASAVANVDDRKRRMTLRHLLNMSTGLEWDERLPYSDPANTFTIMAKSLDWVRYTLDAPMTSEPGTVFNYNSGATLVLGHIFRVATGIDIEEYALRHLLEPLGIEDYFWDRTPSGLADAQEGLYLSTRDLARIMLLVHQRGRWQCRQLIPEAWLQESFSQQFSTAAEGDEAFGLSWWSESYQYRGESRRALFGKGFGGQRPIVLPDLDTIIVVTGWNILPGQPFLTEAIAIEAVTSAMNN